MIDTHSLRWTAVALLILLAAFAVLLPFSPAVMPMPQRDSGIFMYTGWRILHGELPYHDAWDHKPPGIYYIDALGLASGSVWGVWLLELASLFVAGLFCFALVWRAFGVTVGLFSTGLLMIGIFPILQGGNLTTEFTLPLQWICLWLARDADRVDFRSARGFFIGVLTGLMFFTRPNTVGISIVIIVYLFFQRRRSGQIRRWVGEMLVMTLGGLLVVLLVLGYFSSKGALYEFWDAAFHYNAIYSAVGMRQRLISLVIGLGGLAPSGLLHLAFLGYGVALVWQIYKPEQLPSPGRTLMGILLIDFPLELILVSLPGHAHPHYLITLLPVLTWFTGFIFWVMLAQLKLPATPRWTTSLFTLGALGLVAWVSAGNSIQIWRAARQSSYAGLANFITQATRPEDGVLVWSEEGGINFLAQRRSPTRYVYLSPLYTPGYTSEGRILEFLDGVIQANPVMILDAPGDEMPIFEFPLRSERIDKRIALLRQRFQFVGEENGWQVYR